MKLIATLELWLFGGYYGTYMTEEVWCLNNSGSLSPTMFFQRQSPWHASVGEIPRNECKITVHKRKINNYVSVSDECTTKRFAWIIRITKYRIAATKRFAWIIH